MRMAECKRSEEGAPFARATSPTVFSPCDGNGKAFPSSSTGLAARQAYSLFRARFRQTGTCLDKLCRFVDRAGPVHLARETAQPRAFIAIAQLIQQRGGLLDMVQQQTHDDVSQRVAVAL